MSFEKAIEKLKNFVKRHDYLYTLIFSVWAMLYLYRTRSVFRKLKHDGPKTNKKVIVYGVRTIPTTNLVYFDAIFSHAFMRLGWNVKVLYCDGLFKSCDADTYARNQKPQCFLCQFFGPSVKRRLNVDSISFKDFLLEKDILEIEDEVSKLSVEELENFTYLGINVGIHARSAAIRYFLLGYIDYKNTEHVDMLKQKIEAAASIVKMAEKIYKTEKPDVIFMLHGIYTTWGPFFDYFVSKKIDVIVYANVPAKFGRFLFNRNGRDYDLAYEDAWNEFKRRPLAKTEREEIDSYLANRLQGIVGDQLMFEKQFAKGRNLILEKLNASQFSRRFVLFPNLAWDACVEMRGNAIFNDMFEWIDRTIEYFRRKQEYQLVIKPHPAELIWELGTRSVSEYIKNKHKNLSRNIVVLESNVPLTAYDLVDRNTICLTLNGTVGFELCTQGIPVLVTGKMHYKDAGVTYHIKDAKHYFEILDNPQEVIDFARSGIELAKKYAYYWFFKLLHRIPFYREDEFSVFNWNAVANLEQMLEPSSALMKLSKKILSGESVVAPLE